MHVDDLFELIESWAEERNLIQDGTVQAQTVKLMEEVGELAGGVAKNKPEVIKDSIGDCMVVLTIIAAKCDMTVEECLEAAWTEIKDRRGRMVDGVFIKEE